jgi:hypothetical protein
MPQTDCYPKTKNQKPKTKNQKPKTKNQKPKTAEAGLVREA